MEFQFVPGVVAPANQSDPAWWFVVRDFHPLVQNHYTAPTIPQLIHPVEIGLEVDGHHFLGNLNGRACYAVELDLEILPPEETEFMNLRQLHGLVSDDLYAVAGRAVQVIDWDRTHRYCGRCGTPTEQVPNQRAKRCPICGLLSYPRISPAVIVLVQREDEILLARSTNFPDAFYSVLAGFVEPGETLEETVAREIYEESGILVKDIQYFGSQPWPFPNSLMIGFTASYAGGEIRLEDDEIVEAGWYTIDNLPRIPGKLSIARRLIDSFIEQQGGDVEAFG